jgi:hypothetical protein
MVCSFQVSSIPPLLARASLLVFMKFSSSASMTRSVTVDLTT